MPKSPIALDQPVYRTGGIHPALRDFGLESQAMFVRFLAYVSGLALLAIIAADLDSNAPLKSAADTHAKPSWTSVNRSRPAFAISQIDLSGKPGVYEILRHPDGGRKDILRWRAPEAEIPAVEIEVYRPGTESAEFAPVNADLIARMGLSEAVEIEAAGLIDSKFGLVRLTRVNSNFSPAQSCLGFVKTIDVPRIKISGWSCEGASPAAKRAFLSCALSRLMLLSAGNDSKLAELFAHAELRRTGCGSIFATDWVTDLQEPQLRGRL